MYTLIGVHYLGSKISDALLIEPEGEYESGRENVSVWAIASHEDPNRLQEMAKDFRHYCTHNRGRDPTRFSKDRCMPPFTLIATLRTTRERKRKDVIEHEPIILSPGDRLSEIYAFPLAWPTRTAQ